RKFRLFAVACCRRIWDFFDFNISRRCVELGELFADRLASSAELEAVMVATDSELRYAWQGPLAPYGRVWAARAAEATCQLDDPEEGDTSLFAALEASRQAVRCVAYEKAETGWNVICRPESERDTAELEQQSRLVREVFGNPFNPVILDPAWQT